MSAVVLGCGHTEHLHLFETDIMMNAPQVHLHFLTGEEEYEEYGFGKVELCCHGCGASTLVYYTNEGRHERHLQLRDEFTREHKKCPDRNYQSSCPDWRSSHKIVDIRPKKNTAKWRGKQEMQPLRPRASPPIPAPVPTVPRRERKAPRNG